MWCCWYQCQHHMILITLSMPQFCLLGQDNWNKVQHAFSAHVITVLASHGSDAIINSSTITFISSTWSNWNATWLFQSFDTFGTTNIFGQVMPWYLCQCHMMPKVLSMAPFHLLGQDDQKETNMTNHVMPMVSSVAPLHLFHQYNQNEVQH